MAHYSRTYVYALLGNFLREDFKVLDAKKNFTVVTNHQDVSRAVPLHPKSCVIGQACIRRGKPGLIYRTVAYLVHGPTVVLKYVVDNNARSIITANDITDPVTGKNNAIAGVSITLRPPNPVKQVGARHNKAGRGSRGQHLSPTEKAERLKRRLNAVHLQRFNME